MKSFIKPVLMNCRTCPIIIAAIFQNEFYLIERLQNLQIRPVVFFFFPTTGTLEIHDFDDARIERRKIKTPSCFHQNRVTEIEQSGAQLRHFFLQHRLAAGQLDELARIGLYFGDDLIEAHLRAAVKSISRIAPHAAQVATGRSNKNTRHADEARLALYRKEYFGNTHGDVKDAPYQFRK